MHQQRKAHIVCVDADSLNRKLRTAILERAGHVTTAVGSLAEAEHRLQQQNTSLVIVDETAADTARLERFRAAHPQARVLLLKSNTGAAASSNGVHVFWKLDGPEAFLRTVEKYLTTNPGAQ